MEKNSSPDETDRHSSLPLPDVPSISPDSTTHDADHPNGAPTHEALGDIPAVRPASPNNSSDAFQNHDRNVTDECARADDDSMGTTMRVDDGSWTEPGRRWESSDAPSAGVQSMRPVAVVSPMRRGAEGVASESVERDRPRSSSKSLSSWTCQISQTIDGSSVPGVTEVSARHGSDPCASPIDLSPGPGADDVQPSIVSFDANQEASSRKFNRPPTQRSELELIIQSNFFYGHLSRSKVKSKLRHSENGTFLIRYSSDSKFQFALSLKTPNGVTSVRLARNADGHVRLDCDPAQANRMPAFPSVLDLVVNYVRDETGRRPRRSHCIYLEGVGFSETVLDLNKPLEESPASLGHLCRRRINALVPLHRRSNLIQTLVHVAPMDMTQNLIEFLEAYPYRI